MSGLQESLGAFFIAGGELLGAVAGLLRPWLPLGIWAVFWLFAADWMKLRRILVPQSGILALLLITVFAAWISTLLAPVASLKELHPVVERIASLTTWIVVMMGCGTVQNLGWTGVWVPRLTERQLGAADRVRVLNFEPDITDAQDPA